MEKNVKKMLVNEIQKYKYIMYAMIGWDFS